MRSFANIWKLKGVFCYVWMFMGVNCKDSKVHGGFCVICPCINLKRNLKLKTRVVIHKNGSSCTRVRWCKHRKGSGGVLLNTRIVWWCYYVTIIGHCILCAALSLNSRVHTWERTWFSRCKIERVFHLFGKRESDGKLDNSDERGGGGGGGDVPNTGGDGRAA